VTDAPLPPIDELQQTLTAAIAALKSAKAEAAGTGDSVLRFLVDSSLRTAQHALAKVTKP
jgi:hypothetical protein